MAKFIFAYHGGSAPESPEEGVRVIEQWTTWLGGMGENAIDFGNPAGPSKTVSADGIADNGGTNPISGYSLINAPDIAAAVELAKGCPALASGGTVEVAEAMDM
ncbi:hypothetical protein A8B75_07355 [Sphingomonadales bacterium EhC05]|nr:hypothetical protein A8B75_07355 [Sphingomonadales bacterium EhC05]